MSPTKGQALRCGVGFCALLVIVIVVVLTLTVEYNETQTTWHFGGGSDRDHSSSSFIIMVGCFVLLLQHGVTQKFNNNAQ
jgi:multisubunit Na+/H+ antiporter MnhB subunit